MPLDYRLKISYNVTERGYQKRDPADDNLMTFDSSNAQLFPLNYWKGYAGGTVQGFYSKLKYRNSPVGPGICWAKYSYNDGTSCIIGAVLNESMKFPLGRLVGDINISLDGKTSVSGSAEIYDRTGCAFVIGTPKAFLKLQTVLPFLRFVSKKYIMTDLFFHRLEVPDVKDGIWRDPYDRKDRTNDQRYKGDDRNPDITDDLNGMLVPRWEDRYTHYGDKFLRMGLSDKFLNGFLNLQLHRLFRDVDSKQLDETERMLIINLTDWVNAQVGGFSPVLPNKYIDGRPNHLSLDDGTMFQAGTKYNLSDFDKSMPLPARIIEGMVYMDPGHQFTETLNRNNDKLIAFVEAVAPRWMGGHQVPGGSDPAHRETSKLRSACLITGNILAMRHLHGILEEIMSNPISEFDSSMWGWDCLALINGWMVFEDPRYIGKARGYLDLLDQKRVDETPYTALLTRKLWNVSRVPPYRGQEALGQAAPCIYACVMGARFDTDPIYRAKWLLMAEYGVKSILQPGVIDLSRGGIIDSFFVGGPSDDESLSIGERIEKTSAYPSRSLTKWQSWAIGAIAAYILETGNEELKEQIRPVYEAMKKQKANPEGFPSDVYFLSQESAIAWEMFSELVTLFEN